ncbi:MAG TPA: AraC family transcriptional regulator [Puia sp.]|nr:AraC family transcriptional regulator [Puia sp.]
MILQEFPDIAWLKSQIDQGFSNKLGWGNLPLDTEGFPSVIIHTRSEECFRPDIKGPLSLFLNIRGNSFCKVDGVTRQVDPDTYFISNRNQPYTLQIERGRPTGTFNSGATETFNIHFGEYFAESVLNALLTPADSILEKGRQQDVSIFQFFNQLHRRDDHFNSVINRILQAQGENGFDRLLFEQQLTHLLGYLLQQQRDVSKAVDKLPPVRMSTRVELYRRLSRSVDYIHANVGEKIDLEDLSAASLLSKYHFLRLFKLAYGLSPYQYIQDLRIEKARGILSKTTLPVADLAYSLGFDNPQSFSRLFFQRLGLYPTHYREKTK